MSYLTEESAETGTVWDLGTYEVVEGSLSKGAVDLYLCGRKLDGQWRFTRSREQWELTNAGGKLKRSCRLTPPRKGPGCSSKEERPVAFTEPVEQLPAGEGWTYEVKLDGYRAQAIRDENTIRLLSRNGKPLTDQFPGPVRDLQALPPGTAVDGEIVAVDERLSSVYEPGQRSGAWVKQRLNRAQEFVIGGYRPRTVGFDSLLIGFYRDGELRYCASTRNGFVPASRREVFERLRGLEIEECPFVNLPEANAGRWGAGLTAKKMSECRWVKPDVVAQFEFVEWTQGEHLRHAKHVGLREDKDARAVVRET